MTFLNGEFKVVLKNAWKTLKVCLDLGSLLQMKSIRYLFDGAFLHVLLHGFLDEKLLLLVELHVRVFFQNIFHE